MIIGSAVLDIRIAAAQSLKEKRGILLSVLKRTRNKFNVAVAEIGSQELWQRTKIGFVVLSSSTKHVDKQLRQIITFIESEPRLEVVAFHTEIF